MKDTLTIGTIAGISGTIVMHLSSMLFMSLGLAKITSLQASAAIFLNWSEVNTTVGFIIGAIVHLMIGAAGGVLLAYFIKSSGKDYYWLKGLALAGFMLLVGMGLIESALKIVPQLRNDSITTLAHIISYIIYGLVSSYVIAKYGKFTVIKEQ